MIITIEIPNDKLELVGKAYGVTPPSFPVEFDAVKELKAQIIRHVMAPVMNYKQSLVVAAVKSDSEITEKI